MLVGEFEALDFGWQWLPQHLSRVSPSILVPVQDGDVGEGQNEAILNFDLSLVVVEEKMAVYLRLAKDYLEEFQIGLVF